MSRVTESARHHCDMSPLFGMWLLSAANRQDRTACFADDCFGDASKKEARQSTAPVGCYYEQVRVIFSLCVKNAGNHVAGIEMRFVVQIAELGLGDIFELGPGCFLLVLDQSL